MFLGTGVTLTLNATDGTGTGIPNAVQQRRHDVGGLAGLCSSAPWTLTSGDGLDGVRPLQRHGGQRRNHFKRHHARLEPADGHIRH